MLKLKKIITDISIEDYTTVEEMLIKNNAKNFLFLLRHYRENQISDNDIISKLELNYNSFYVLKFRLHEKILNFLSKNIRPTKIDITDLFHEVNTICYTKPRETAISLLKKLEKDLLSYEMHNELLILYSALKKLHIYSQKYEYYSQLYDKHLSFIHCIEKAEELLGSFNRQVAQYHFSRSFETRENLHTIREEISQLYIRHPSRQIKIIQNITEIQLVLFCHSCLSSEIHLEEKLNQSLKLVGELPEISSSKAFHISIEYLYFEFYKHIGNRKYAKIYFDKIMTGFNYLLLKTNISFTSMFLLSKISFLQEADKEELIGNNSKVVLLYDDEDLHSRVLLGLYEAMLSYHKNKIQESVNILNNILKMIGLKDFLHINFEIKLTLAYFYINLKEFDLAENILRNISRKIKKENLQNYQNVLDLVIALSIQARKAVKQTTQKQKNHFALFLARNTNENKVLEHLESELIKEYA